ncbi:MAG: hypothetical protein AAB300_01850 [Nitrospirota bacterium]
MPTTPSRVFIVPPVAAFFLPVFLAFCILYFLYFAADLNRYDGESGLFQYALNDHDHFVYVTNIDRILFEDLLGYEISNDIGIAAIYMALASAFPFLVDQDYTLIALVFNCITLIGCYVIYADICNYCKLGQIGNLSFFANLSLIYFAQMINKDMLTIFAFLLAVRCGIHQRMWLLLALIPFFALVRLQLAVFILIFAFLMATPWPGWRIICLYILTSIAAGVLSIFVSIISDESLGEGFSSFLVNFNRNYYVGYLLFNPLRVIQFIFDAYASFSFSTEMGGVDMAKILRLPQLILLLLLFRPLGSLFIHFRHWLKTRARPIVLVVVAYLLTWLMNPTINARYVMLITPVLVLFALYARRYPIIGRVS